MNRVASGSPSSGVARKIIGYLVLPAGHLFPNGSVEIDLSAVHQLMLDATCTMRRLLAT
jgi:hypothetical protein